MRGNKCWIGLLFAVALTSFSGSRAQAQDAARDAFHEGAEAFDSGDYVRALERFSYALELTNHPTLYYNVGLAHDRLRHDEEAIEAFETYLERVPDGENRASVVSRIAAIREAVRTRENANEIRAREIQQAEAEAAQAREAREAAEAERIAAESARRAAEADATQRAAELRAAEADVAQRGAELEEARQRAAELEARETPESSSKWWVGVVVGAVVVGVGVGLYFALRDNEPQFAESDFGTRSTALVSW